MPAPLRRVFEEVVTTGHTSARARATRIASPHRDERSVAGSLRGRRRGDQELVALRDHGRRRCGRRARARGRHDEADGDGAIRVRWPDARDRDFSQGIDALHELGGESGVAGKCRPIRRGNSCRTTAGFLFDNKRGPLLTVHPLGGCPMGDTAFDCRKAEHRKKGQDLRSRCAASSTGRGQVFNGAPPPDGDAVFTQSRSSSTAPSFPPRSASIRR